MNADRNPVGWFEIWVQDMDRTKTFYERTLDLTLAVDPESLIFDRGAKEVHFFDIS